MPTISLPSSNKSISQSKLITTTCLLSSQHPKIRYQQENPIPSLPFSSISTSNSTNPYFDFVVACRFCTSWHFAMDASSKAPRLPWAPYCHSYIFCFPTSSRLTCCACHLTFENRLVFFTFVCRSNLNVEILELPLSSLLFLISSSCFVFPHTQPNNFTRSTTKPVCLVLRPKDSIYSIDSDPGNIPVKSNQILLDLVLQFYPALALLFEGAFFSLTNVLFRYSRASLSRGC